MNRHLLLHAGLTAFALVAAMPAWQSAQAQARHASAAFTDAAAGRYYDGLRLQRQGDERGAFLAFQESAEGGYPPAQRRMGEIYDNGSHAVERNYEESIRWYQKARDGGEQIPPQKPRMQGLPGN